MPSISISYRHLKHAFAPVHLPCRSRLQPFLNILWRQLCANRCTEPCGGRPSAVGKGLGLGLKIQRLSAVFGSPTILTASCRQVYSAPHPMALVSILEFCPSEPFMSAPPPSASFCLSARCGLRGAESRWPWQQQPRGCQGLSSLAPAVPVSCAAEVHRPKSTGARPGRRLGAKQLSDPRRPRTYCRAEASAMNERIEA